LKRLTDNIFRIGIVAEDLHGKIADRPIVSVEYKPECIPVPITEKEEPIIAFNSSIQNRTI
jgi:hypothetical protein